MKYEVVEQATVTGMGWPDAAVFCAMVFAAAAVIIVYLKER